MNKVWQVPKTAKKTLVLEKEQEQFRNQRLKQIKAVMVDRRVRGNPRDFVLVLNAATIIDGSGVFELQTSLPAKLEPGNHVWLRYADKGFHKVSLRIIVEDNGESLLVKDEAETFTEVIPRTEAFTVPIPLGVQLVHKKKIGKMLGVIWGERFWNKMLKIRRNKPWK